MTDVSVKLPSLERELYDARFGTDTRYGLGAEQIFVDPVLAESTIRAILTDPDRKFEGVNIDNFLNTRFNLDDPNSIIDTMNAIYEEFTATDVNFIFFRILEDAFSTKKEYEEIFKTSWVALQVNQNIEAPQNEVPRRLNLQPGGTCFIESSD